MISVEQAEHIILAQKRSYGTETISLEMAIGRVLAEDISADRDLPACDRATMDGIAIRYTDFDQGIRSFFIKATITAGNASATTTIPGECLEIMTGSGIPAPLDTIVRYEDLIISDNTATIIADTIKKGQNIHRKGKDKKQSETVVACKTRIDPTVISMAASVGKHNIQVYKLPHVAIISTGNELVDIQDMPTPWQIRRSNSYTMRAVLEKHAIRADLRHLPDDPGIIKEKLGHYLSAYDVILLSGGVSMGRHDYVPQTLDELGVTKLFHKVQQRPGKPFWFGTCGSRTLVFAFPGNPVSAFMCLHRYFIPWLESTLQISNSRIRSQKSMYAILDTDIHFAPALQYFVQVRLQMNELGHLLATPIEGNGSGDFANLVDTDAFMELPMEKSNFKKGEAYRIWPFKQFI